MPGSNSEARKHAHPTKTELELANERIVVLAGSLDALQPALLIFSEEFRGTPLQRLADTAMLTAVDAISWRPKET